MFTQELHIGKKRHTQIKEFFEAEADADRVKTLRQQLAETAPVGKKARKRPVCKSCGNPKRGHSDSICAAAQKVNSCHFDFSPSLTRGVLLLCMQRGADGKELLFELKEDMSAEMALSGCVMTPCVWELTRLDPAALRLRFLFPRRCQLHPSRSNRSFIGQPVQRTQRGSR